MLARLLITSIILIFINFQAYAQTTPKIEISIKDVRSQKLTLAYYYGSKQYIENETLYIDESGKCTITNDSLFDKGLYLLVFPEKENKYIEFMMGSDQQFTMKFELAKPVESMEISGSEDNTTFFEYQQYRKFMTDRVDPLKAKKLRYEQDGKSDSIDLVNKKLEGFDTEFLKYQNDLFAQKPNSLFVKMLGYIVRPNIPDNLTENYDIYNYYCAHLFDKTDWTFDPIVRTPFYESLMTEYMDKLTTQTPDSIIVSCDKLLSMIPPKSELYKTTLIHLVNKYAGSNYVCFDAIYVHLVLKYYKTGTAYWMTDYASKETLAKMIENAEKLKPSICGATAQNFTVRNESGGATKLTDLKGKYTLLVFWTPDADESSEIMAVLNGLQEQCSDKGVQVIGISTATTNKTDVSWMTQLYCLSKTEFEKLCTDYDAVRRYSPVAVLLDENKKIKYKKLGDYNIGQVINNL